MDVYIYYLCYVLGIIHGNHCDRKNTKNNYICILFK